MKKHSLKINLLALALGSFGFFGLSYATDHTNYIEEVANKLKKMVLETQGQLESFIDEHDNHAFSFYEHLFEQKLTVLHEEIKKMEEVIKSSSCSMEDAGYLALKTADDILHELHRQMLQLRNVLKNKENKAKALTMATALQKYVETLAAKCTTFNQKLEKLTEYLSKLELADLAQEVSRIIVTLDKAKKELGKPRSKPEQAAVVLAIRKKLELDKKGA